MAAALESTGLAPAEALAYRTLLRTPTASVGDLAHRLGMSILDARTALRGLEAKGLIGRMPGGGQRFRVAAPPDEAFRPLMRQRRADLRAMSSDVDALAREYQTARPGRDGERVEVIGGDPADAAVRLVRAALVEVCALVTDAAHALPSRGRAALKSGVRERTVYPRMALGRPEGRQEIRSAIAAGVSVRVVDRPPFAMLAVDRTVVLVPADGGVPRDGTGARGGAVIVHVGGLHDSLVAVFDRTWSIAEPVRVNGSGLTAGHPSVTVPCPDDLRLLTLLLDGLTDEAIATKLDVGTRTVQRRVRDLIEASGVRTRLQLIWQATRRGWI